MNPLSKPDNHYPVAPLLLANGNERRIPTGCANNEPVVTSTVPLRSFDRGSANAAIAARASLMTMLITIAAPESANRPWLHSHGSSINHAKTAERLRRTLTQAQGQEPSG